jgi:Phosphodiester glycosidase
VVLTDLFALPALLALYFCYRWRRRRVVIDLLPLPALLLLVVAVYWLWYAHRPQPAALERELARGIHYRRESRTTPRPILLHRVEIELTTPGLEFFVTPRQPVGAFDMPARTTSQFAREFDVQAAINASYFYPFRADSPFSFYPHVGEAVNTTGLCVSNGRWYSSPEAGYTMLAIDTNNRAAVGADKLFVWNGVAGQPVLLQAGRLSEPLDADELNPRTAVGIDRAGTRMIWLIVDGRQPRFSEGVTFRELAELLHEFGAWDALALDGGGSSTLVARRSDGEVTVLNWPIHGRHPPGVERPVANHLGVRVRR